MNKKNHEYKLNTDIKIFNKKEINKIINKSKKLNSYRICFHKNLIDKHQEMIIYQKKGYYYPPKKNTKSDQTFYIISGKLKLIIFNKKGKIKKKIVLSPNENLYARIKKGVYFCDIALTDKTLHLETKNCIYSNNTNKLANFKFDEKNF